MYNQCNSPVIDSIQIEIESHERVKFDKRIEAKSFLVRLLNELTKQELNELARDIAKNDLVDICLFLRGGFNITTITEIAEIWLRITKMSHRFEVTGDFCRIIIEHDMGQKYSYLIKEISKYLLEVACQAKSSCDVTENAIVVKIWRQ